MEELEKVSHTMAPISKPVVGAAGKTGAWRIFRPVIDYNKCIKCYQCWMYCPDIAIEAKWNEYPKINYDFCKGCGICANVCPRQAIRMVREHE